MDCGRHGGAASLRSLIGEIQRRFRERDILDCLQEGGATVASRAIRIMTQKVRKILYSRSKHLEIAIVLVHIAYESQQKLVSFSQDFEFHDDVGQT